MRYGIVGSGNIGSAVASQFVRAGMDVAVANSRGVSALTRLVDRLGPHVVPTPVSEALQSDVVVLAVPFEVVRGLVEQVSDWKRRIIVDATNAIDYRDFSPLDLGGLASSDLVEQWARNARVVKAFGHTWARVLAREPRGRQLRNCAAGGRLRIRTHRPRAQRPGWSAPAVRRSADHPQLHLAAHRRRLPG
jgi:8-hydroxy-5-deazaflavin:NADPH oxidoreductase